MSPRESLIDAIAFALTRCKRHFRVLAQSHNTDEARQAAAKIIADQVLRSGLEITPKQAKAPPRTP